MAFHLFRTGRVANDLAAGSVSPHEQAGYLIIIPAPRANFLVDFSCLYAPVALTTSIVVWTVFHVVATLLPLFYLAATMVIFWRVGAHMERLSGLRQ
jgi:hypothetical protein